LGGKPEESRRDSKRPPSDERGFIREPGHNRLNHLKMFDTVWLEA
jgi:hypothetical protein